MSRISAHDTAIYVDSENTTLDKVLKKVTEKVTEIDGKVDNIKTDGTLIATKTKLGNVKIGEKINVDNDGTIDIPYVGNSNFGGIVNVTSFGTSKENCAKVKVYKNPTNNLSSGELYVQPASTTSSGTVKVGNGLEIDSSGVLSLKSNSIELDASDFTSTLPSIPELGAFTDKGLKCAIVLDKTVNANTKLILRTANGYFLNPINFVSGYTWHDNLQVANGCAIYKDLRDDKIYIVVRQQDIG